MKLETVLQWRQCDNGACINIIRHMLFADKYALHQRSSNVSARNIASSPTLLCEVNIKYQPAYFEMLSYNIEMKPPFRLHQYIKYISPWRHRKGFIDVGSCLRCFDAQRGVDDERDGRSAA